MDTRKQRTDDAIKAAYRTCLRNKSPDEVTVTDICRTAGINRTTFYRHYSGCEEVFGEIEADQLNEFRGLLRNDGLPIETLLRESLISMDKAAELYHVPDSRFLPDSFKKGLTESAMKYGLSGWKKLLPGADEAEAAAAYEALLTGALQAVISADRESREKVVSIIMDMVNAYVRAHSES